MTSFGYFLSCEEFTPRRLLDQARPAEDTGFTRLAVTGCPRSEVSPCATSSSRQRRGRPSSPCT